MLHHRIVPNTFRAASHICALIPMYIREIDSHRASTDRGSCVPSAWSWQVILGFPSSSQSRHARWCASHGALTTRSRPVPSASCGSPSVACSAAVSLRARTGVLASSFILEAGGLTPPWSALRGSTIPRIARPLRPHWCALRCSNRTLAHAPLPH